MTKGGKKEEANTPSQSWRRLADVRSEVRGDGCIDAFYFQVVSGERKKGALGACDAERRHKSGLRVCSR